MRSSSPLLKQVVIRNNKQNVTDLQGTRLFKEPLVSSETYGFSAAEQDFYAMLTEFIMTGKAYASTLGATRGNAVILVLIAMQKLASSSVAAIRRAIEGRLTRLAAARVRLGSMEVPGSGGVQEVLSRYKEAEEWDDGDGEGPLEERLVADSALQLQLMEDEERRLRELLAAAERVTTETKITKILSILQGRFTDRPVLLFTEYKATQSLVISALLAAYGPGCAAFINGDNLAEDVVGADGSTISLRETRDAAAARFNAGAVRFLVSTEAGGEGIDLQERCHSLIHVDLPWNPMRLHQRVGRLNRYGQRERVEVISLRNPDTVESRIWEKLNGKIDQIMLAFGQVMDQPEDLLQLVLGMTSPSLFREIFAEGAAVPKDSLSTWFDHKTARFGGQDVVRTVQELVGNCAKFDFQRVSPELPQVDLPDLLPFILAMLARNKRRPVEDGRGLSFSTPEAWRADPRVRSHYSGLIFDRTERSADAGARILGVGHVLIEQALRQALGEDASVGTLPSDILPHPMFFFRVTDQVTGRGAAVRAVLCAVSGEQPERVLRDWELLLRLNDLLQRFGRRRCLREAAVPVDQAYVRPAAAAQSRPSTRSLPRSSRRSRCLGSTW